MQIDLMHVKFADASLVAEVLVYNCYIGKDYIGNMFRAIYE